MADMNPELAMFTTIQNVPTLISDNAIALHNGITGDDWNRTWIKHPDIQMRIGFIIDMNGCYEVIDGKCIEIEQELF